MYSRPIDRIIPGEVTSAISINNPGFKNAHLFVLALLQVNLVPDSVLIDVQVTTKRPGKYEPASGHFFCRVQSLEAFYQVVLSAYLPHLITIVPVEGGLSMTITGLLMSWFWNSI